MRKFERQYLESLVRHTEATLELFSNRNKIEREKMIVRAFLRCLGTRFSEAELIAGPEEPVDITFRMAQFQIREILGGHKPGVDVRRRLERYRAAKSMTDITDPSSSSIPLTFAELAKGLPEALSSKARKYGTKGCAELDALVYLSLRDRHLYPPDVDLPQAVAQTLWQQGWRSVSIVFIPYSAVVVARRGSPRFLKLKAGHVLMKWTRPDGWFDR